ncbi:hypothetical protein PHYBLDRAFT_59137 [Phycomyces blakesleeanus NRRL 1555(-)]|uniref:DDE-1 domain-containing protein n=1 Tax=Phycomyces blakesleeanus (strain ATCC 8743b / DSM 1359 / FGSC 10004 / NBRC 33097 / NRRL 1555) TaxID=763407 RepID=A0A167QQV0_PHYB8|nr:hypothetical protein PHYBLDRAFT_59137 [Phycomyces blakesleeanus NRRL 1555(-)]OAD80094.1 hypothetical protein PHYBLDRAFT_59137 [Phycomyces blakesleeanus NRRL 1555(-)]|eukprot:XP_018298134.1 hypothetical protein PHYBLDRAFT_59137 [Phycomyces blakesleeanus NRRL 1555(-)]
MNNTDNSSISLLHVMYNEILFLKAGQEKTKLEMKAQIKELKLEMKTSIKDLNLEITALQSQLDNRNISNQHTSSSVSVISSANTIHKLVSVFCEITLKHIFKMISEDLGIEVTSNEKATLNMCTKLICDDMAAYPLVIALGPNPSWGSIPVALKKEMCARHANIMKDSGIDITRCLGNWASTARVAHLWRDRHKRLQSLIFITMSHLPGVLFFWKDLERPIDMILLQSDQSKSFAQKRKVLLTLNNFSGHIVDYTPTNVELLFLSPNTTSHLQPLDGGIIRAFKAYFKRKKYGKTYQYIGMIQNGDQDKIRPIDKIFEIVHVVNEYLLLL